MTSVSSIQSITIQFHDTIRDNIFENTPTSVVVAADNIVELPILTRSQEYNGPEEIRALVPNYNENENEDTNINTKFGIINIAVQETPINNTPIFVLFTNDISGSMMERCADGCTKMEHSIHTISNILTLFANNSTNIEIWVQVNGFDDKHETIIPPQQVTADNLTTLLCLLQKMRPRNGTNIELAIQHANVEMRQFREQHPDFIISHIFTTDGQANIGSCDAKCLSSYVDPQFLNTFIGFGYDHSALILNAMANNANAQYYFIDNIEKGGLVFGEIIHTILYRALTDVVIRVKNESGTIYNYKTNTWDHSITIGSLTGEANKVYHLRCLLPDDLIVEVTGVDVCCCIMNREFIECATRIGSADLSKYMFRQKTQELLYESQQKPHIADFKMRLDTHHAKLKRYMELFQLTEDPFFVGIHDDVVIIINTLGTNYSDMFTIARANANGRGLSYNVSDVPTATTTVPNWMPQRQYAGMPQRQYAAGATLNWDYDEEDEEAPTSCYKGLCLKEDELMIASSPVRMLSSHPVNRAYSTPRQQDVMRSCSQPMASTQQTQIEEYDENEEQLMPTLPMRAFSSIKPNY